MFLRQYFILRRKNVCLWHSNFVSDICSKKHVGDNFLFKRRISERIFLGREGRNIMLCKKICNLLCSCNKQMGNFHSSRYINIIKELPYKFGFIWYNLTKFFHICSPHIKFFKSLLLMPFKLALILHIWKKNSFLKFELNCYHSVNTAYITILSFTFLIKELSHVHNLMFVELSSN